VLLREYVDTNLQEIFTIKRMGGGKGAKGNVEADQTQRLAAANQSFQTAGLRF
jgi:hypothetical protein